MADVGGEPRRWRGGIQARGETTPESRGHPEVPRISAFFGVLISMYHHEHEPPHFHATYAGKEAALTPEGVILVGDLPPRILRLVREWAALHRQQLRDNWTRARRGRPLERIPPLE